MRKLIVGLIILICGFCFYDLAQYKAKLDAERAVEDVYKIYNNLTITMGSYERPEFQVLKSDILNAWYDGKHIVITTALIEKLHNKDAIAMILGHELGHSLGHHLLAARANVHESIDLEAQADRVGAFVMLRAGYDICAGREAFQMFLDEFGEDPKPTSHPDFTYRLNLLTMPWCSK